MQRDKKIASAKNLQKARLIPYFPYGFCSQTATTLEGLRNPYARRLRLGNDEQEVLEACKKTKRKYTDKVNYLIQKGLVRESGWKCGTPTTTKAFRALTKAGLAISTEVPLEKAGEDEEDDEAKLTDHNGKIKVQKPRCTTKDVEDLQELLDIYGEGENDSDQEMFDSILLEAVIDGLAMPLAKAYPLIQDTKIITRKYSKNQLLSIWRTSHISTMFRLCYTLTYLDRRHYDTGFAIDGIYDEQSYQAYISKHGHTVASTTYYALTKWYGEHPGYYQIIQRQPDESEDAKMAWLETPAFYLTKELPRFERNTIVNDLTAMYGSKQKINATAIGLAAGKKQNYICYHGTPNEFKWDKRKEQYTKHTVEGSIHKMRTQNPAIQYNDKANHGLIFCSSHHQFTAIFDRTIERHKKKLKGNPLTDEPYVSLHAIPVNDCGCYLLWHLMEASPGETEMTICKRLVGAVPQFDHQTNLTYPLTYDKVNVFVGHTMDIKKINQALEDYLDGKKFYLVCFPEQIKWYRKLFPDITIL